MSHCNGAKSSATMLITNPPTARRKVVPAEDHVYAVSHKSDLTTTTTTTSALSIPILKEPSLFPIHVLLRYVLGLFGSVLILSMVSQYLAVSHVASTSNTTCVHPATSSVTASPTSLPHKEIQAILATAKRVRSELDGQLRGLRREVWFSTLSLSSSPPPPPLGDVETVRRRMASYVEQAETTVRQQAEGIRKRQSVWGAFELTAIEHAERHALFEVRKVVVLMDEIEVVLQQRLLRQQRQQQQQQQP